MASFENELETVCLRLFDIGALKFGDFVMKSGSNSPVYFDLRVMIAYPRLMDQLANIVQRTIERSQLRPRVVCGVPYTALPVATLVSVKMNVPMVLRRKEPKKYGTMKLIEGKFNAGDECLIIEDVVTSGSSILETAQDLRKDGLLVKDVIIMLDREQGGLVNLTNEKIKIHSILTLSKVMDILLRNNKVNQNTVDLVKKYVAENQIFPNGDLIESSVKQSTRAANGI